MKEIEIEPLPLKTQDGQHIRTCLIKRITDKTTTDCQELWFSFDSSIPAPDNDDCDSYLLATLMDAMKEGRHINIKGSVSKTLLSNLTELQSAWHKWLPRQYSIIAIHVCHHRSDPPPVAGAVCAFSGGVDATFSVWHHHNKNCGYRTQHINFCTLVHGFDIPLHEKTAFQKASGRAQTTLADLQIKLYPVTTNYREIATANWEHCCASALVAALINLKRAAGTCIIGSSDPYNALIIPWGSNPITDHLLGTDSFIVMHDGASHNRNEKVSEISEWKQGVENLRVCWEGDIKDVNCGVCEKCVRTKLNFLAARKTLPSSIPHNDILKEIENITLRTDGLRLEWRQIYTHAKQHGITSEWVEQLPKKFRPQRTIKELLLPNGSRRRLFGSKLKTSLSFLSKY